ncbi:Uroporphyrinogen-III synthase [Bienertia sinuspersici]
MTINSLITPTPTIAFTTPENNYASRLSLLLTHHHFTPLSCPTVIVGPTSATTSTVRHHIFNLHHFSAVAFTSRAGISAFSSDSLPPPLPKDFIFAALGKDAELLTPEFISKFTPNFHNINIIIPSNPTPSALVDSLGPGLGRKILCPVPLVVGLHEPPVVPEFLSELGSMGWVAVRADAYETRWAGPNCAGKLLEVGNLDGIVFTSTAEVEGLLKSLREFGLGWEDMKKRWPGLVVAAHGPVTASGAERLGVKVDVVSSNFSSFDGVVQALDRSWRKS